MTPTGPRADALVPGTGAGELLVTDVPLSFWGGVDPLTGEVVDRHHPLSGTSVAGRVLALPGGRGSCTGSAVLLELVANGVAPAALLVVEREEILSLGAIVADVLFGRSLPVCRIAADALARLPDGAPARVEDGVVLVGDAAGGPSAKGSPGTDADDPGTASDAVTDASATDAPAGIELSELDRALLDGAHGEAAALAMRVVLRTAVLQGAERLLDVTRVHVDGCIYTGPASLAFAHRLVGLGARVRVPTTLNALSVDRRRWQDQGIDPAFATPAEALADAYLAMGAEPTYTCAPYLLDGAPEPGEQIAWAESNAVAYANGVLGARTQKYPDFLDACIALTGRAPATGAHLDAGRLPTLRVEVAPPADPDDAFWPLLGHAIGQAAGARVPLVVGLEHASPSPDDLKGFAAAFATTASAPTFHLARVTPEAAGVAGASIDAAPVRIGPDDVARVRRDLDTASPDARIDVVCLGNLHFSAAECARLARLLKGRTKATGVELVVTLGRAVHASAAAAGDVDRLERFGARLVTDTCWCMLGEPVIPPAARTLMTNSAKYAHYAPGLTGRAVRFGSLAECVEAACGADERATPRSGGSVG